MGHLLGHEGPGSLLSTLKSNGWVNSIVGGLRPGANGFSFFILNGDLTIEGIRHVDTIVKYLFQVKQKFINDAIKMLSWFKFLD